MNGGLEIDRVEQQEKIPSRIFGFGLLFLSLFGRMTKNQPNYKRRFFSSFINIFTKELNNILIKYFVNTFFMT